MVGWVWWSFADWVGGLRSDTVQREYVPRKPEFEVLDQVMPPERPEGHGRTAPDGDLTTLLTLSCFEHARRGQSGMDG